MESPNYGQQNSARPYCLETPRQILPCGHDHLCPLPARWPYRASQPTVCRCQCQFRGGIDSYQTSYLNTPLLPCATPQFYSSPYPQFGVQAFHHSWHHQTGLAQPPQIYASMIHMPTAPALGQPQPGARPTFSPQRPGLNYGMGPHGNAVLEADITYRSMPYRSMHAQQAAGPPPPPPITPIPARRSTYQASPATFPRTSGALSSPSSDVTTLPHRDLSTPSSHANASQSLIRRKLRLFEEVKIKELPEEDRSCSICYHDFGVQNPEGIKELPLRLVKCKHVFGEVCIKRWFEEKESDKCPCCHDKLVVEME